MFLIIIFFVFIRDALVHCTGRLTHRRRQLAAELSYIFPIIEVS